MSSVDVLQRAIQATREGRKVEARDLLIKLVEADPQNETAWMWLARLVDSLESSIFVARSVCAIS